MASNAWISTNYTKIWFKKIQKRKKNNRKNITSESKHYVFNNDSLKGLCKNL